MDSTLVIVTVLSMGMAAALSAIVWRLLRTERARSNARVAALTELAARDTAPAPAADLDLPMRPATAPSAAMFTEREPRSPWGARLAVMGGLAMVGASLVLFMLASAGSRAAVLPPRPSAPAPAAQAPAAPAGLELMSLHDSRQTGSLTITGLVQNPRTGAPLSRVTVTAYTFDESGAFLASGRALLDVTSLAPGDESPFVVTVPVKETVARYRIGFRTEDGRVLSHVDRRQQGPIAALRPGSGQALRPFDALRVVPSNAEGRLSSGQANW